MSNIIAFPMRSERACTTAPAVNNPEGEWFNLPPPFDNVLVRYQNVSVEIEYWAEGRPEDLLAAGVIDAQMLENHGRRTARVDSHGDTFLIRRMRRDQPRAGHFHVERKLTAIERAHGLPGIPPDFRDERTDWLKAHPGEIHCGEAFISRNLCSGTAEALLNAFLITSEEVKLLNESRHRCIPGESRTFLYRLIDGFYGVEGRMPHVRRSPDEWREEAAEQLKSGVVILRGRMVRLSDPENIMKRDGLRIDAAIMKQLAQLIDKFDADLDRAVSAMRIVPRAPALNLVSRQGEKGAKS